MGKLKNWLLPAILILSGFLDLSMDLLTSFYNDVGWPSYCANATRIFALFLTVVVAKLQPPSLKEEKRKNMPEYLRKNYGKTTK